MCVFHLLISRKPLPYPDRAFQYSKSSKYFHRHVILCYSEKSIDWFLGSKNFEWMDRLKRKNVWGIAGNILDSVKRKAKRWRNWYRKLPNRVAFFSQLTKSVALRFFQLIPSFFFFFFDVIQMFRKLHTEFLNWIKSNHKPKIEKEACRKIAGQHERQDSDHLPRCERGVRDQLDRLRHVGDHQGPNGPGLLWQVHIFQVRFLKKYRCIFAKSACLFSHSISGNSGETNAVKGSLIKLRSERQEVE